MAPFAFRALPVFSARDATLDFEQLTFALNNGAVEINAKGESKLKMGSPELQVAREVNKAIEPSSARDALVLLQLNSKPAEVLTTISLVVGGLQAGAVVFPKLAEESVQTVTLPVPAGKKWEAKAVAGALASLSSSYAFFG